MCIGFLIIGVNMSYPYVHEFLQLRRGFCTSKYFECIQCSLKCNNQAEHEPEVSFQMFKSTKLFIQHVE